MADARYASWIRQQPCALCLGPGPCHAHHHTEGLTYDPEMERPRKALGGKRGKSQKADDVFLMPLHLRCHKHVHEFTGPCSDWSQQERRTWQDDQVKLHRNRYAMQCPEPVAPTATPSRTTRKRATAEGPRERELFLEEIADWAGAKRLKDHEHQLIHDLINDLRAGGI